MDTKKPRGIIFHKKFIEAINQSEENPYDVHIKGLKYDKVKEQRDELFDILKTLVEEITEKYQNSCSLKTYKRIVKVTKAIKYIEEND